ncbi:hypothetical protein [Arthrobacter sp. UYEF3]|uniref:hypothetical protein n=1 Tax=Arthrobacter sp. UYEF3 TaxID=1756365 RepID=UPI0033997C07
MNHASDPAPDASYTTDGSFKTGGPHEGDGVLKAMSPGVVDFLFRRLVAGEPAEDVQWHQEGTALSAQAPGAELARRLAETDLEALTPTELFHYVRAAQRLTAWAEALREDAVSRYCAAPAPHPAATAPRPGRPATATQEGRI